MNRRTRTDRRHLSEVTARSRRRDGSVLLRLAVAGAGTSAAVAAALAGQPAVGAVTDSPSGGDVAAVHSRSGAGEAMASLTRSLRDYQDVSEALADGFVPVGGCTESPEGGMGVHYLHPARAAAPVDPTAPAILLYGPTEDGGLRLLGAEWFQADADQDPATDDDRPALWGRPFDGPMPGHEPGMPVHYDLHVWLHDSNPAGVFSPWNPSVSC